jgi:hypothetical protein
MRFRKGSVFALDVGLTWRSEPLDVLFPEAFLMTTRVSSGRKAEIVVRLIILQVQKFVLY